ncbi:MAG: hypothetical protein HEQ29_01085 [Dolichospermum sp. LBC05a]|nr:hypothetical protein [Dolichospermum sp. OL01]MCO5795450.1 hypothetical protein [Dolichospermum sp. OL03]MCS6282464.1 hypothetical protein [Dolichospermum sp.]QSV57161.1 MAG: hypothetical protein HEQ29_01085 [Dolichospermum sp. LBC05a]
MTGGDNGSDSFGRTTYSITNTNPLPVKISFNWLYSTNDDPGWDWFDVNQNGIYTDTAIANSNANGTYTTLIATGDVFGFSIATVDNILGRGSVTISDFSATPVPFESNAAPAGMAIVFGALMLRRRLQQRSAQKMLAESVDS